MTTRQMLIGGKWQDSAGGDILENINPATGQVESHFQRGTAADIDRAVTAARKAFDGPWSDTPADERGEIMRTMATLLEASADTLAEYETRDMGKPLAQSRGGVGGAADFLRYFAGLADKIEGHSLAAPDGYFGYSLREPFGVVGCIVPWNFPLPLACIKVAPALAAGNAVILKPSSSSPRTALELGRIGLEAGLPDGVLNVVTGLGTEAGAALAEHHDVGKISFTGSTEAGRSLIRASAGNVKKLTLELGGKTPNIILPDADLDMAIPASARTIFLNSGQICTAGSRLVVHEQMKDEILQRLVEIAENLTLGDPMDEGTKLGPIVSQEQWERVDDYVQCGIEEGARVVTGGAKPDEPRLEDGCFYAPTIFDGVTGDMRICREEIFGPVLCVQTYRDIDQAVEIANDCDYGLAADIWTTDIDRAHNIARRLEAGIIWINCTNVVGPWMSYGGYRQSGLGFESGIECIHEFTRLKTVIADTSGEPNTWALD
ncbi:MAG: aldehyde dehydrogenase family protein [Armatimonadota bacterium]